MLTEGAYAWRCTLCDASGYGGPTAFTTHYDAAHTTPTPDLPELPEGGPQRARAEGSSCVPVGSRGMG
jgi:hypothetical protein